MTLPHLIEAAVGAGLVGLVAYRLAKLPAALAAKSGVAQSLGALTGQPLPLAQQPCAMPWVNADGSIAAGWRDPTELTVTGPARTMQTPNGAASGVNEWGFLLNYEQNVPTTPAGAPMLTNADVCATFGHAPGNPCPRCGVATL